MVSVNTRKGRISVHNTKYLLPYVILYLNAEVGGLSIRLKIKKEKKIKIKTTNANRKQQQQQKINIIPKLGFELRSLAWKASVIATGVLYHMDNKRIYEIFVRISVPRMGDQQ